jgi:branched-subunit amino acid permease
MITFLKDNLKSEEIALRLILVAILIFVLQMGKKMRSKYFVMFWIEAIPIFWLGLLWLSERYG